MSGFIKRYSDYRRVPNNENIFAYSHDEVQKTSENRKLGWLRYISCVALLQITLKVNCIINTPQANSGLLAK